MAQILSDYVLNTFQSIGCRHKRAIWMGLTIGGVLNTFQSIGCRHEGNDSRPGAGLHVLNTFQSIGCRHDCCLAVITIMGESAEYLSVDRL